MSIISGTAKAAATLGESVAKATPASNALRIAKGATATGVVVTTATPAGRSLLGRLIAHPLVLFSLGVASGYALHKYRKEIIESANRAAEIGMDFVLQQRENLEDLIADNDQSGD